MELKREDIFCYWALDSSSPPKAPMCALHPLNVPSWFSSSSSKDAVCLLTSEIILYGIKNKGFGDKIALARIMRLRCVALKQPSEFQLQGRRETALGLP
ncbi:hypothetical protein NPIL_24471 [Nephila pilipes]|uniref:Uncharacterized protein n=1 Tax=Nephila pilipes TaxID=299642 RepID=A0A8X6N4M3_NEPPI|nr:hypothetical protein NPIL_24471 [Nephila pilipes]